MEKDPEPIRSRTAWTVGAVPSSRNSSAAAYTCSLLIPCRAMAFAVFSGFAERYAMNRETLDALRAKVRRGLDDIEAGRARDFDPRRIIRKGKEQSRKKISKFLRPER